MLLKFQLALLKKPLVTIILFNVLTRLFIAALYFHVTIFPDSEGYIDLTELIISLNLYGYPGFRSLGYPLLMVLAGNIPWLVVILQILCGIITAVFQYKTFLLLNFTKKTSLYITLFINSLIHIAFYEFAILTETITLLFLTLSFYYVFRIFKQEATVINIFIAGFLLGYLILIKPFYIFAPFLVYILFTIKFFKTKGIFNKWGLILVFPLISYLGWSYVNKINTGHFTSSSYLGINLAQNCVYFAEAAHDKYPVISDIYVKHREKALQENKDVAMTVWFAREELQEKTGLSLADLSYTLIDFSKVAIVNNTSAYLKQVTVSWREFWFSAMYWNYDDFNLPFANKFFQGIWYIQRTIIIVLEVIFILLIPFYILKFISTRKVTVPAVITVIVFAGSVLQAMVVYGTNSRFSFPFEPLMFITVFLFLKERNIFPFKN